MPLPMMGDACHRAAQPSVLGGASLDRDVFV